MRLFGVYNRAYKLRYFIAEDVDTALAMATKAGHIKRPQMYRRWVDLTDKPPVELGPRLVSLLAEGRPGMLIHDENGWQLSS